MVVSCGALKTSNELRSSTQIFKEHSSGTEKHTKFNGIYGELGGYEVRYMIWTTFGEASREGMVITSK